MHSEVNPGETEPTESVTSHSVSTIDRTIAALTNPVVIKGLIGLIAGIFFFVGVETRGSFFRFSLVTFLFAYAATDSYRFLRELQGTGKWPNPAAPLVAMGLGTYLLIFKDSSGLILGTVLGVGLMLWGVVESVRGIRNRKKSPDWSWTLVKGLIGLAAGLLGVFFPVDSVLALLAALAAMWVFSGVLAIRYAITTPEGASGYFSASAIALDWFDKREFSAEEKKRVVNQIFFEGHTAKARLSRFAILMGLSVSIASFGVIQDSTAVVIGAMLIAPLMTPIEATSAGIIMGWPKRAARAALTVAGGAIGGIGLAYLIGTYIPAALSLAENSQIVSRTSPNLIDLLIALTAGAAGAFAVTRQDVSDSLPGVAIAVALVPPLSVVGITLARGSYDDAGGALLLFLTNLVCIILSGAIVFVLVGFSSLNRIRQRSTSIRVALGTVVVALLLIAIPLTATGSLMLQESSYEAGVERAADDWLPEDSSTTVSNITISGEQIAVIVRGPDKPPPAEGLAQEIEDEIGSDDFTLDIDWVVTERYSIEP